MLVKNEEKCQQKGKEKREKSNSLCGHSQRELCNVKSLRTKVPLAKSWNCNFFSLSYLQIRGHGENENFIEAIEDTIRLSSVDINPLIDVLSQTRKVRASIKKLEQAPDTFELSILHLCSAFMCLLIRVWAQKQSICKAENVLRPFSDGDDNVTLLNKLFLMMNRTFSRLYVASYQLHRGRCLY